MPKRNYQQQKLHLLMKDASIENDNSARKVGAQLVSDVLNGVAMPCRQMPTPSFVHKELYRAPTPQEGYHVETVDPTTVEMDSQFQSQDARAMWDGARNDMDTESDASRRFERMVMSFLGVVGAIFMFVSLGMAFAVNDDEALPADIRTNIQAAPTQVPTPTPLPILPRVGGN